jgi:hypothetical protein
MKASSILRILGLVLALSLLLVLIPATPALALPEITLSPGFGSVGTQVTVSGTGFESFAGTDINIFFDGAEIAASPLTVPENGTFTASFEVPDETEPGTAYVKVTTVIGGEVRKSFIVEEPEIELDIDMGAVGTMVTVEGRGFYAGGTIDLYYYRDGSRVSVGDEVAGDTGEFAYTFSIPNSTAGRHEIKVEDVLDNSAEANFEVIPAITVSPSSGAIGDELMVRGAGFSGDSEVTIYFNNIMMAEESANKYGSFEVAFSVPTLQSGTYDIEAEDAEDSKAGLAFTVAAGANLNPATGFVGAPVTVSGVGFKAGALVTITYDGEEVATAIAGSSSTFSVNFIVPSSSGGNHNVTITDGTNTATCIFTMETDSPPAPVLIFPEDNTRAEARVSFDWEDVNDESGVTYTLQVATKDSFAVSNIVLDKAGLTDSEYDVAEEEKLAPSSKEAPHFWRVKAVDNAANESEWSDVGSFYVGSRFTLSETVKKVLIGLGIAGAGFFGFWLGRRTAYARRV